MESAEEMVGRRAQDPHPSTAPGEMNQVDRDIYSALNK
jgi:hypothetical protein